MINNICFFFLIFKTHKVEFSIMWSKYVISSAQYG